MEGEKVVRKRGRKKEEKWGRREREDSKDWH